jgi:hypothetical protein
MQKEIQAELNIYIGSYHDYTFKYGVILQHAGSSNLLPDWSAQLLEKATLWFDHSLSSSERELEARETMG